MFDHFLCPSQPGEFQHLTDLRCSSNLETILRRFERFISYLKAILSWFGLLWFKILKSVFCPNRCQRRWRQSRSRRRQLSSLSTGLCFPTTIGTFTNTSKTNYHFFQTRRKKALDKQKQTERLTTGQASGAIGLTPGLLCEFASIRSLPVWKIALPVWKKAWKKRIE